MTDEELHAFLLDEAERAAVEFTDGEAYARQSDTPAQPTAVVYYDDLPF